MTTTNDTRSDDFRSEDDRHDEAKSPDQLEREVDQARARLGRTANELSDRLSPGELMDQALGMAREHGGEFGRNLGAQVKSNPLPMILTSVGLSWLMMASGKNDAAHAQVRYDMSTGEDGRSLKDSLGDTAANARDKAAAVGDRMHMLFFYCSFSIALAPALKLVHAQRLKRSTNPHHAVVESSQHAQPSRKPVSDVC